MKKNMRILRRIYDLINRRGDIIDYFMLLTLALIIFWQMGISGIWWKGDHHFQLHPVSWLSDNTFAWYRQLSTGFSLLPVWQFPHLWHYAIWAGLTYIGIPLQLVQRIYLVLMFVSAGLGMYYFMDTVAPFQNRVTKRLASVIASTFYMINGYTLYWFFLGAVGYLSGMAALPLCLAFVHKGFKASREGGNWLKYALFTAFSSIFVLTVHPSTAILALVFFGAYITFLMVHDFNYLIGYGKFVLVAAFVSFALNLWWIVPILYKLPTTLPRVLAVAPKEYSLLQMLRLNIIWEKSAFLEIPQFLTWRLWVKSPLFVIIGLALFSLATLCLIAGLREKHFAFFALATIISIGFAVGPSQPFGPAYTWLFDHVGIFKLFKEPFRFMQVGILGYSFLLGISTAWIYRHLSNCKFKSVKIVKKARVALPRALICITISLIFLNSLPLMTGDFGGFFKPAHVPEYYFEADEWLKRQDGDFRVLIMPQSGFELPKGRGVGFTWLAGGGHDLFNNIFEVPVLDRIFEDKQIIQSTYSSILQAGAKNVGKRLALFDVRYIVVADDVIDSITQQKIDTERIQSVLQDQEDLELAKVFGDLHIYENKAWRNNLIYGTTTNIVISEQYGALNQLDIYMRLCKYESFHPAEVAIFTDQQLHQEVGVPENTVDISQYFFVNWSQFNSADNKSGWISYPKYNYVDFSVDTEDYVEGRGSLKILSHIPSSHPPSELVYGALDPSPWNWSDKDVVGFWFKASSSKGKYVFYLSDVYGNRATRAFTYSKENSWQWIILPLGDIDLTKVDGFKIQVFEPSPAVGVMWKVDDVKVGKFESPEHLPFQGSNVSLIYKRINPTRYEILVKTREPFTLVFSESYDHGWKATVNGEEIEHFEVNGYANGWHISKTGEYTVILKYEPQNLFFWSATASLMSAVIIVFFAAIRGLKGKSKRVRNGESK